MSACFKTFKDHIKSFLWQPSFKGRCELSLDSVYEITIPDKACHRIITWNSWHLSYSLTNQPMNQLSCPTNSFSFIIKTWMYIPLIRDGWNCLIVTALPIYSPLDAHTQRKNLCCWLEQQLITVAAVVLLWLPALLGHRRCITSPLSRRCAVASVSSLVCSKKATSVRGKSLRLLGPPYKGSTGPRRDQGLRLASRANSPEGVPCFLHTSWN